MRIAADKEIEVVVLPEAEVVLLRSSRAKIHDTLTAEEAQHLSGILLESARMVGEARVRNEKEDH